MRGHEVFHSLFLCRIGIWKCWFLRRDENGRTRRKTVVVVRWSMSELSGDVRGYRLVWYSSGSREKNEVFLPGDANGYEIWSASLR